MLDGDFFCRAFFVLAVDLYPASLFRWESVAQLCLVGDEDAVEMIDFMLEASCEQTRCFDAHFLTLPVQARQHAAQRSLQVADLAGYRQAAFDRSLFTFEVAQHRVDEDIELVFLADIRDKNPLGDADLWSGQADAGRLIHRPDHVVNKLLCERQL